MSRKGRTYKNIPNGTKRGRQYESFRIKAHDYVRGRDAKIDELVADIRAKYPRLPEAEARRIVVEHWAAMEQANDVRNTVRSLDLGFDERELIGRLNGRLKDRLRSPLPSALPDRLSDALRGPSSTPNPAYGSLSRPTNLEAVRRLGDFAASTLTTECKPYEPTSEEILAVMNAAMQVTVVFDGYADPDSDHTKARRWIYQAARP